MLQIRIKKVNEKPQNWRCAQPEAKRTKGRPAELKPLCEFSPPAIREKTDKGLELLEKEWSNVNSKTPIPFDKYLAKLAMRHYFNTGDNLDKQKGEMFNKVVTLLEVWN